MQENNFFVVFKKSMQKHVFETSNICFFIKKNVWVVVICNTQENIFIFFFFVKYTSITIKDNKKSLRGGDGSSWPGEKIRFRVLWLPSFFILKLFLSKFSLPFAYGWRFTYIEISTRVIQGNIAIIIIFYNQHQQILR